MAASGVGTLRETPLHAALKQWCSQPGDRFEQPVEGFVVDVVRDDLLIEVQTRSFGSMQRKLDALLDAHPVRVVHPIAVERHIVRLGEGGEVLSRRRSPKKGVAADLFAELVSFPTLVDHPNLTLHVVFTREDEIRVHEPGKAWRRKGWVVHDRHLLEVVDELVISSPDDLGALVPASVPDEFTTADLASAIGRPRRLAQQMAFCLRALDALRVVGRDGNAYRYARAGGDQRGTSSSPDRALGRT